MLVWLRSLTASIFGRTGRPDRVDTATRMAIDAELGDRRAPQTRGRAQVADVDPIDELMRIVEEADGPAPRKAHLSMISSRRRPSKGRR